MLHWCFDRVNAPKGQRFETSVKKYNMFYVPSQPGENQWECLGEFKSRSAKTRDAVKILTKL